MTKYHPLYTIMLGLSARMAHAYSYYVDVPGSYELGTCHADLPHIGDSTGGIRGGLNSLGWAGTYYETVNAWATDFIEGTDAGEADARDLAIFDGHGNVNNLAFAYPSPGGTCDAGYWGNNSSSNIAMGLGAGGKAAMFIPATCCYMNRNTTIAIQTFGGNQILGFGSISSFDNGMLSGFFSQTGTPSGYPPVDGRNWHAWLYAMEDKPGWLTGDNTTVTVTRGWNTTDINNNRQNCGLKRQTCITIKGYGNGPNVPWTRDYIDHGCGGCALC